MWLDRYARQISQLPIFDVDPDLLDFGKGAAEAIRALAGKMRTTTIAVGTQSYNQTYSFYSTGSYVGPRGGDYESGCYDANPSANSVARRLGKTYSAASAVEVLTALENSTDDIRRPMTERYKVEF